VLTVLACICQILLYRKFPRFRFVYISVYPPSLQVYRLGPVRSFHYSSVHFLPEADRDHCRRLLLVDLRDLLLAFPDPGMEGSFYNLRQRPFPVSTTTDSLATIVTSSVSTVMSYPSTSSSSGSSLADAAACTAAASSPLPTPPPTSLPTLASLRQKTLDADSARGIGLSLAAELVDSAASFCSIERCEC